MKACNNFAGCGGFSSQWRGYRGALPLFRNDFEGVEHESFQFSIESEVSEARAEGCMAVTRAGFPNQTGELEWLVITPADMISLELAYLDSGGVSRHYSKSDFYQIAWSTNGGVLDFSTELVGQPTAGLPFGSKNTNGEAGDVWYFWVHAVNDHGESVMGNYDSGYVALPAAFVTQGLTKPQIVSAKLPD